MKSQICQKVNFCLNFSKCAPAPVPNGDHLSILFTSFLLDIPWFRWWKSNDAKWSFFGFKSFLKRNFSRQIKKISGSSHWREGWPPSPRNPPTYSNISYGRKSSHNSIQAIRKSFLNFFFLDEFFLRFAPQKADSISITAHLVPFWAPKFSEIRIRRQ